MNNTLKISRLSETLSVCGQVSADDVQAIADLGFKHVICNRPDGEADAQPSADSIQVAFAKFDIGFYRVFVEAGSMSSAVVDEFAELTSSLNGPILAYCRSGTRSATLWASSQVGKQPTGDILATVKDAGFKVDSLAARLNAAGEVPVEPVNAAATRHDVVIVGGGAGGIAAAASLLKRHPGLDVAVIEPSGQHYYQPGWTLVGAGIFKQHKTVRPMHEVMPQQVTWIPEAVTHFKPEQDAVVLRDGSRVHYKVLIAAPGIKLDWAAIDGLVDTLGKHNVTSNYHYEHATYTWELVQNLQSGRAVFTQPPMPIKCAGAPQKAMYLSCSYWERAHRLSDIDVQFYNAGGVLFGVPEYVPALESYVARYGAGLNFNETLVAVDGPAGKAYFDVGEATQKEVAFDLLHVSPPQTTPDVVRNSDLVDQAGWIDVDPESLQHTRFANVFSLGDACSAPNAKTAAAVRKQAPVVAVNVGCFLNGEALAASYDGYGSCPLTVERGKVVLAEFGYGGALQPTAPSWLLDGTKATRMGWVLKADLLPTIYFQLMLKGREWFAAPDLHETTSQAAPANASLPMGKR